MNLVLVRIRRGKRSVVPWLDVDFFQSCPCSAIACLTGVLGVIRAFNTVCTVVASARSAARIVIILVAGDVARRIDCIIVEAACAKKTRPGPLARRVSSTAGATDTTSSSIREIARQAVVTFS